MPRPNWSEPTRPSPSPPAFSHPAPFGPPGTSATFIRTTPYARLTVPGDSPPTQRPGASPLGDVPGAFVNLSHRLRYVAAGYLASMDAELNGVAALPATRDVLAAFHPVVCHHLARKADIAVAPMRVIEDEEHLIAPCRIVPAHPWAKGFGDATTLAGAKRVWTGLSMNGAQPVAMFETHGKPFEARAFLGMTTAKGKEDLAWRIWRTFHIPLVRIHGHQTPARAEVTHLEPLRLADLSERDLHLFAEVSERPFSGASWTT